MDAHCKFILVMLAILLECLSLLTGYFLKCARSQQRSAGKYPFVMDLLNPSHSVIITCLQYLSSLIVQTRGSNRFILLAGLAGCDTIGEWVAGHTTQVRHVRRMTFLQSGAIYKRHWKSLNREPWAYTQLADDRLPMRVKQDIVAVYAMKKGCCLKPGVATWMKRTGVTAADMQSIRPVCIPCPHQPLAWVYMKLYVSI